MCAIVFKYAHREHDIGDRKSGGLSWRDRENATALGPGRSPCCRAHKVGTAHVFRYGARRFYAPNVAEYCESDRRLLWSLVNDSRHLKNQRRVFEDFCAIRGVCRGSRPRAQSQASEVRGVDGPHRSAANLTSRHCTRGSAGTSRLPSVRAFLPRARNRVACPQQRTTLANARLAHDRALLFRASQWPAQLLQETQRGADGGHKMKRTLSKIEWAGRCENSR
jgi:hypothetical protein